LQDSPDLAKKEKYTVTKLIGVSPQGKLMMYSRSYRGALNDMNLAKKPFSISLVQGFEEKEAVGADKGFVGLGNVWNVEVVTPFKKRKQKGNANRKSLKHSQKKWNQSFKTIRTVVENYFSQLKDFKILRHKLRVNGTVDEMTEKHHRIWTVCAGIMDQFIFPEGTKL